MSDQLELTVEPCWWCRRPHEYLCDQPLRGSGEIVTCDARMCEEHARLLLRGHICARPAPCEAFELHRCPYCEEHQGQVLHRVQAEQHRAAARAHGWAPA